MTLSRLGLPAGPAHRTMRRSVSPCNPPRPGVSRPVGFGRLPCARWRPVLALLLVAVAAGCGYRQDVPVLPAGARSLAILPVRNLTDTGELDVRMRALLLRRLQQHAHLRLDTPEHSALAVSVELRTLTVLRTLDPAITTERGFSYALTGTLSLVDQRSGQRLIDREAISGSASLVRAADLRESPAIRDEGIDVVLAAFADAVEERLFRTF